MTSPAYFEFLRVFFENPEVNDKFQQLRLQLLDRAVATRDKKVQDETMDMVRALEMIRKTALNDLSTYAPE
jgi:hypothetical protein